MRPTTARDQQPTITDPALYLNTAPVHDWISQHLEGSIDLFLTKSGIPRSTFYRALKGSPISSSLLAQIHLFTRLPLGVIVHMEQRRRAS